MVTPLEFEKTIHALENKLHELMLVSSSNVTGNPEVLELKKKIEQQLQATYKKLTPWQKVLVARHTERPSFKDYLHGLIDDFVELSGDRTFSEDRAIIAGIGRFRGQSVMIMGHQKGNDTESRIRHNFGMARPEGYRKVKRLMLLADRFQLPLLTLIDTAGAHPGIDAEERGQAEAIAASIETMADLKIPVVSTITGEGGSGGAIAIAVANCVNILEHSIYSVISPEGCASILWRTSEKRELAAEALQLTAQDLIKHHVVDRIIEEPIGGAHRNPQAAIQSVGDAIESSLKSLSTMNGEQLRRHRQDKFLKMGRLL
ncbi:MAG: acetyl-CoA carboxylase carboxyltransferase subunit alpha [Alphaproteobacteria bacterium]|nr:acetyl-CoA carboxylase carboxyltransferase subunit alpha [Alphaproteobacteria bacterium]